MRTRLRGLAATLLVAAVLTGCTQMPTSGPVVEIGSDTSAEDNPGTAYDPRPPVPGESPDEIVAHFLDRMQATPIKTSVARQFLTTEAGRRWRPEDGIITYSDALQRNGDLDIRVDLVDAERFDARGAWEGALSGRESALDFELTTEDGEWRITNPPDALIVPQTWFESRYRRDAVYFFDPTGQVLVPEPVYVPEGDQMATALVRSLLAGPPAGAGVSRSYLPAGVTMDDVSVPITDDGTAQVALSGLPAELDPVLAERILAQLAWTLRAEPRIRAVSLLVDGEAVPLSGGASRVGLDVGADFDPNGADATTDLFGLLDGRLVRGSLEDLGATSGPLGVERLGVRSVAASVNGAVVAGVSGEGTALLLAPINEPDGRAVEVLSGASDLLAPRWDLDDRVWLVDRTSVGAALSVVVGDRVREVRAPGVTGERVKDFLVSRDGSRLVTLVEGPRRDRLVLNRIRHNDAGRVLGLSAPQPLFLGQSQGGRVSGIAWRSATTLAVLSTVTEELSQVRTIPVDGAPDDIESEGTVRLRGRPGSLVSSPEEGDGLLLVTGNQVEDVITPNRLLVTLDDRLTALTYAG